MYACCIVHLSSPSIFMHPFKFKATHFCLSTWVISLVCHLLPLVNCGPNGQPWNPRARQSHPSYYLLRFIQINELKPKTHWGKRRKKDFFSINFFAIIPVTLLFKIFFVMHWQIKKKNCRNAFGERIFLQWNANLYFNALYENNKYI